MFGWCLEGGHTFPLPRADHGGRIHRPLHARACARICRGQGLQRRREERSPPSAVRLRACPSSTTPTPGLKRLSFSALYE